jgi:hypothetical protein
MHGKANGAHSKRPTHAQDVRDQAVVLTFVLTLNPDHLTIPDLARSLNGESSGFKRPDAVERAARDLVGVGLVVIDGGLVQPTAAALRFIEIIESGV